MPASSPAEEGSLIERREGREVSATKPQPEPEFRGRSEFFEVLLRIRDTQGRRYAREVPPGLKRRVSIYESLKREREGRKES
jgi:hypothetical protein